MPATVKNKILYIRDKRIFDSDADVLVNSVNIKGVMGAGIAREFANLFPEMYKDYKKACKNREIRIGGRFLITVDRETEKLDVLEITFWEPHIWKGVFRGREILVLNFPSKIYWDLPSHPKIIEAGLKWICNNIENLSRILGRRVTKIALPQIGTGLGKLKWGTVKGLIEKYLSDCDGVTIEVYLNYSKSTSSKARATLRKITDQIKK